jgi:cytochrome bd ubiquinol oxidase subunit I
VSLGVILASALPPAEQQHLLQARQMQALSFAVHIPLVCFGIAFPAMVLFVEWLYLRTGDGVYLTIARRWTRVMAALFAVGVITGTILSFEMGLLWPNFTGTFGSVFGLGFAIEGFSFFIEAIFIGIYVYGWDRLSRRAHFLSGIPIVLSGFTGSLMVIAVNAWMNHPGGFRLVGGKVADVNPWRALFGNTYLWHELVHMYIAGYIVTGFLVAGAYAVARLRGRFGRYERTALAIPLTIAALASPVQVLVGDWAARDVAHHQPIKLAALEGLGRTTRGAPIHVLGWYSNGDVKYGVRIPRLLSFLAFHNFNAKVRGLDSVPPKDRPPVNGVRFAFQTMVGIGTLLALLGLSYLVVRWRRGRPPDSPWFYRGVVIAGPLSVVALIAGWVTTELGRQPWVVYDTMRTAQAVTGAGGIPVGYATLTLVYVGVAVAVFWILRRLAAAPMPAAPEEA